MTDTRPPEAQSPEAATAGVAAAPGHAHPTEAKYVQIALILAAITAAEVASFYFDDELGDFMVPALIVMMIAKFSMVAMWFMHLKFDSRLFSRLFITGIIVAVSVYIAALSTFRFFE
jgi:cytochrome c oxidase subunit 4